MIFVALMARWSQFVCRRGSRTYLAPGPRLVRKETGPFVPT